MIRCKYSGIGSIPDWQRLTRPTPGIVCETSWLIPGCWAVRSRPGKPINAEQAWLAHLRVYDNSIHYEPGTAIGAPTLFLEMRAVKRLYPATLAEGADTPEWAKPVLEVAFELDPGASL